MSGLENQSDKTLHFMRAVRKISSILVMQDEEKGQHPSNWQLSSLINTQLCQNQDRAVLELRLICALFFLYCLLKVVLQNKILPEKCCVVMRLAYKTIIKKASLQNLYNLWGKRLRGVLFVRSKIAEQQFMSWSCE